MTDATVQMIMKTHSAMIAAGREYEREIIAKFIRDYAENWERTPTFNFRIELHKLAEAIEKGNNE